MMEAVLLTFLLLGQRQTSPSTPATRFAGFAGALISPLFVGIPIMIYMGFSAVNAWYFGVTAVLSLGLLVWLRFSKVTFQQLAIGTSYFLKTVGFGFVIMVFASGVLSFVSDSFPSRSGSPLSSVDMVSAMNHMVGIFTVLSSICWAALVKRSLVVADSQNDHVDSKLHLVVDNTK